MSLSLYEAIRWPLRSKDHPPQAITPHVRLVFKSRRSFGLFRSVAVERVLFHTPANSDHPASYDGEPFAANPSGAYKKQRDNQRIRMADGYRIMAWMPCLPELCADCWLPGEPKLCTLPESKLSSALILPKY